MLCSHLIQDQRIIDLSCSETTLFKKIKEACRHKEKNKKEIDERFHERNLQSSRLIIMLVHSLKNENKYLMTKVNLIF